MELVTEPDIYTPTFKDNIYQDKIPFDFTNGIRCPCCTRKDKRYDKKQFKIHMNAKKHKEWISHLNENRVNYYQISIQQEDTIKNQKIYIAKLELELKQIKTQKANVPTMDLLGID